MVEKTIRPDTRSKRREREASGLDVEFRAELEDQFRKNPVAELGYLDITPSEDVKVLGDIQPYYMDSRTGDVGTFAWRVPNSEHPDVGGAAARTIGTSRDDLKGGDILLSPDAGKDPIIAHELTHAGLEKLRNAVNENPDYWIEKYGEDVLDTLFTVKDERLTEVYDDLDTKFNLSASDKPVTIRSSVQDLDMYDKQAYDQGFYFKSDIAKRAATVAEMAADLLEQEGVPPKATAKKTPWWKKLFTREYNKGGLAMKQLSLFEEGGMIDDNLERDPVSGNEIPPGSLAEEVRDDVPAKLSAGEYVLSADVVQFYGLGTIEKMVKTAQDNLERLEDEGRIGGEKASIEEEDVEEEDKASIDADNDRRSYVEPIDFNKGGLVGDIFILPEDEGPPDMAFATGGFVSQVPPTPQTMNPFNPSALPENPTPGQFDNVPPKNAETLNEGQFGVPTVTPDTFAPYAPGYSIFPGMAPGQFGQQQQELDFESVEYRTYQNDKGEIKIIPFRNGEALQEIPEGFKPQGDIESSVEEYALQELDTDIENEGRPGSNRKSLSEMTGDDLLKASNTSLKLGNFIESRGPAVIGGLVAGPIGSLVARGANRLTQAGEQLNIGVASALANAKIAEARGDTATANSIYDSIVENSQYESIEELDQNTRLTTRADRIYNRKTDGGENIGTSSTVEQRVTESTEARPSQSSSPATKGQDDGVERGAGEERRAFTGGTQETRESISKERQESRTSGQQRADSIQSEASRSGRSVQDVSLEREAERGGDYGYDDEGTASEAAGVGARDKNDPRGFNKGGLAKKKASTTKKKTSQKGLATRRKI